MKFQELFRLIDASEDGSVTTSEVIFTLLEFKDLLMDLKLDKFVSEKGIQTRDKDQEINFESFKELICSSVVNQSSMSVTISAVSQKSVKI